MSARDDTVEHINRVRELLADVIRRLERRALVHDASKLESPEVETFEQFSPRLRGMTYGSQEYSDCLAAMRPALEHHYAHNSHHPEHFPDGIEGMSLLDLIEMLMDWRAATERHADGDVRKSIEHNAGRFGYGPWLSRILLNTIEEMGL